jgi:general nucleoside transport system permease protein
MGLPAAAASLFQGALLFFLLGADVLVNYRVRVIRAVPAVRPGLSA